MKFSVFALSGLVMAALTAPLAVAGEQIADLDCNATEIVVYFPEGEAHLTSQAEALLDHIAAAANPCTLTSVETETWVGETGTEEITDELANARRMTVLAALAERGLVARAHVEVPSTLSLQDRHMPIGRAVQATLRLAVPSVG